MRISDSQQLVFVHIQKTGGSTVSRLLEASVEDVHWLGARHQFAIRGKKKLSAWDDYFKFAFVRNPWARLVSWHAMIRRAEKHGRRPQNRLWRYAQQNSSNFDEFIRNCTDEVQIEGGVRYSFTYNQLDYVTDENGEFLVDFIGRLESFDEDLRKACGKMGIELETVPHKNRSNHTHYSEMYTPEIEQIVRDRFKRDIEYFGYEFERPRTGRDAGGEEAS